MPLNNKDFWNLVSGFAPSGSVDIKDAPGYMTFMKGVTGKDYKDFNSKISPGYTIPGENPFENFAHLSNWFFTRGLKNEASIIEKLAAQITEAAPGGSVQHALPELSDDVVKAIRETEGGSDPSRTYDLLSRMVLAEPTNADPKAYEALLKAFQHPVGSPQFASDALFALTNQTERALSDLGAKSLRHNYVGSGSSGFNEPLREAYNTLLGSQKHLSTSTELQGADKLLEAMMENRTPVPLTVWRGVHEPSIRKSVVEPGDRFQGRSLTSTSLHEGEGRTWAGNKGLFKINLPKGTPHLVGNSGENELILPPASYKVRGVGKTAPPIPYATPKTTYELELDKPGWNLQDAMAGYLSAAAPVAVGGAAALGASEASAQPPRADGKTPLDPYKLWETSGVSPPAVIPESRPLAGVEGPASIGSLMLGLLGKLRGSNALGAASTLPGALEGDPSDAIWTAAQLAGTASKKLAGPIAIPATLYDITAANAANAKDVYSKGFGGGMSPWDFALQQLNVARPEWGVQQ